MSTRKLTGALLRQGRKVEARVVYAKVVGEHEAIDSSFRKVKGKFEEIEDELEAIRATGGWSPPGRGNPSDWVIQCEDPREPSAPLLLD
jgi:hypothetical protein